MTRAEEVARRAKHAQKGPLPPRDRPGTGSPAADAIRKEFYEQLRRVRRDPR